MNCTRKLASKTLALSLVSALALPAAALAAPSANDLAAKYDALQREMEELKAEMEEFKGDTEEQLEAMDEKSEDWTLASRITISGDIRSRIDWNDTKVPEYWNAREVAVAMRNFQMVNENSTPDNMNTAFNQFAGMAPTVAERRGMMAMGGVAAQPETDYDNDSVYTTRLRLNFRVKATENVEVKARLVGYKLWGMDSPLHSEEGIDGVYSPYFLTSRSFDGTNGRQPGNSAIMMDRAFMNWNNIAGMPLWFSIGRRPTSDGPPAHLRMGMDKRMATPINYMDYPFDGVSVGYAYAAPFDMEGSGRVRICYGRGFEAGSKVDGVGMNDVDFAGVSWDVYKSGSRFINIQSFGAFNIFNVPGDTNYPNPIEIAAKYDENTPNNPYADSEDIYLDRKNLGNIYHTSALYLDKVGGLNYFLTGGWSRTAAKGIDELGASLLGSWGATPEDKDGYGVYFGVRYDMDELGLKLGAEYNWGSENWLAFTPGHDDMYSSKLYTRGSVYEVYMVYDLPSGEAFSKYGKAFMRLGYQHYSYDYTYSGMWLGTPADIDDLADPLTAQFYAPIEEMDQIYLTFEAAF